MGKSNRKRTRPNRANPMQRAVKPPTDPELVAIRDARILPIVNDLKNPDPKSRTAAASAIANIVQDAKCRKLLLREQVVPLVMEQTLTDASIDSRAAGWDILRVLAQEEDPDFCVHLYRIDILTAIEHAAKAIIETLTATEPPFAKLFKAQQRVVWEISHSLVSLLGGLALARDEILDSIIKNHTIVKFLFRLVVADGIPTQVWEETLSTLTTLSEDNLHLGQLITDDQETHSYEVLLKFASGGGIKAALACGVLHNIFTSLQWQDHSPGKDGATDATLIPYLAQILEQTNLTPGSQGSSPAETLQTTLEVLAAIATDLQAAIENGNRLHKQAAAEEEWNGFDDSDEKAPAGGEMDDTMDVDMGSENGAADDDDDSDMEDFNEDMEKVTGHDDDQEGDPGLSELPTMRELINSAVPQIIAISHHALNGGTEEAQLVHNRALGALNNLAWTMSMIDFSNGENSHIFRAWSPAARKIWTKTVASAIESEVADLEMASMVTSLAWAVARSLNGEIPLKGDEVRKFVSLYQAVKGMPQQLEPAEGGGQSADPFQSITVKCIGVLSQLARHPAPVDRNREIGVFLMTVLGAEDVAPAEKVEALDQIFEIYGDEKFDCDQVFWKDGFLSHLQELLPKMKVLAKTIDPKVQGELRAKTDEAILNLNKFINYKRKRAPKQK